MHYPTVMAIWVCNSKFDLSCRFFNNGNGFITWDQEPNNKQEIKLVLKVPIYETLDSTWPFK